VALKPNSPVKANHRFIRMVLNTMGEKNIAHIESEYDRVSRVFGKMGGSWAEIFKGSVEQVNLLKKVLKFAVKHGHITKSWGDDGQRKASGR